MELWICGKFVKTVCSGQVWDIIGVFDSKQKAIESCRDETYFIGPIILNHQLPHDREEWQDAYYPLAGKNDGNS